VLGADDADDADDDADDADDAVDSANSRHNATSKDGQAWLVLASNAPMNTPACCWPAVDARERV
jgi:hypothetical protein